MNLYEIEHEILECVDMETGEIVNVDALNALEMERDSKIENIALWIKNLLSDAEQIKAEREALAEREKAAKNKADSLKKYLAGYLNGSKFSTSKVAISFRKSESVDVTDINMIMRMNDADSYLKYKDPDPDKTAIKQAIKSGKKIPGCCLVEKQNIQIK
ncbi:MAG: siphovirus Gp157 family protein [Lachnospiraceae bacterium]|nr:siphovirus Gp157 family protein [Lachnospiraceae bacterium]